MRTALFSGLFALLSLGMFSQAGCTDPAAWNYDPSATEDDGSCIYCDVGEVTVKVTMTDALSDGWNGAYYSVNHSGTTNTFYFGALEWASTGDGQSIGVDHLCFASGCGELVVDGPPGTLQGIGWKFEFASGEVIAEGSGMFGPFFFPTGISCDVICGCLDPACINYNPYAFVDDGSCACLTCPGDLDGTGEVDSSDVLGVLGLYGSDQCPWPCVADLDQDGFIGVSDLLELIGQYGVACGE